MNIPFTTEQFFQVIAMYNTQVFPAQILIFALGLLVVFFIHSRYDYRNRIIGGFLGMLWIWTGAAYHIAFFTSINKTAYGFGFLFILQGILILIETFARKRIDIRFKGGWLDYLGYFFIIYGLIIYPLLSNILEGSAVQTITLGLPCPSIILTFGFLMLTSREFPKYLLIIPTLWAVVGLSAALNFGVYQDFMMIVAALVADIMLIRRRKSVADPA